MKIPSFAKTATAHVLAIIVVIGLAALGLGWGLKLICINEASAETHGLIVLVLDITASLFLITTLYERLKDIRAKS